MIYASVILNKIGVPAKWNWKPGDIVNFKVLLQPAVLASVWV
jgi:hypothetical protein